MLVYYYGQGPEVRVPVGVKHIGMEAFSSRPKPEVLEAIPPRYRAQYDEAVLNQIAPLVKDQIPGNPYIRRVVLPEGIVLIQDAAFYKCSGLKEINFPQSLQYIGCRAFCQCVQLPAIDLPRMCA